MIWTLEARAWSTGQPQGPTPCTREARTRRPFSGADRHGSEGGIPLCLLRFSPGGGRGVTQRLFWVVPVVFNPPTMGSRSRYTVLRKIADGGMAEIYLGSQHGAAGFERPIVIKHIRAEFAADPQFRTMLIDEAHIAMGLNHGNIAQVLDLGTSKGRWFLVMEMVDGWDAETLLRRARGAAMPMPLELVCYITAEVCRALAFAHSRSRAGAHLRIVHRDVSPENILLSEQGEVKLTDFGIATAVNKRERTVAGVVKGKLGFMSPEQASGLALDGRSDIYSLGASLYVMVTGAKPFQGKTELEILLRHQEGAYVPLEVNAPNLPAELANIIRKAMSRFPEERFATADHMLMALEQYQREHLRPAGQTEMKQWMAALVDKDGSLPTSRRAPPLRNPEGAGAHGEGEIRDGTALELQEVDTTNSVPIMSDTMEVEVLPWGENPGRMRAWLGVGALLLALGGASAYWYLGSTGMVDLPLPSWMEPTVAVDDAPDAGQTDVAAMAPPEQDTPEATASSATAISGEATSSSSGGMDSRAQAVSLALGQTPQDSSSGGQPPSLEYGALGTADDVEFEPVTVPHEFPLDAGDEEPAAMASVSVKILSEPAGASVTVNGRSFGQTPMTIRFKPGLTHDVVMSMNGFVESTQRVYISGAKGQSIQMTLHKAPR